MLYGWFTPFGNPLFTLPIGVLAGSYPRVIVDGFAPFLPPWGI